MTLQLWFLVIFTLLQRTQADKETVIAVDSILPRFDYLALDPVQMDSSGFVNLSPLDFRYTNDDGDISEKASIVDIVVFAMTDNVLGNLTTDPTCSAAYEEIGITNDGYLCCHSAAQKAGACTADNAGRLIVNEDIFDGVWLSVSIHSTGFNTSINPYEFDPLLNLEKRGYYSLLFANCNENTTNIEIKGDTLWVSFFTDEEIENSVPIYIGLTVAYLSLLLWFLYLMYENQSSSVQVEIYIIVTIVLGLMETVLETIYYANETKHLTWLAIITEFYGTAKNGVSRCLLLMLSMGWGVTVSTLEQRYMITILALGTTYMVLSLIYEVSTILESAGVEEGNEDDEDGGTVGTVGWILSYVDVIIWYWIPTTLCKTMKFLQENGQERKLQRYRWLLGIMIVALVLNILAFFFITMEIAANLNVNITIWPEVNEGGFFLTLACVAILWRPNPNAREYAYVMELSPNDEVFDLELTEVSSAVFRVSAIDDEDIEIHPGTSIDKREFS